MTAHTCPAFGPCEVCDLQTQLTAVQQERDQARRVAAHYRESSDKRFAFALECKRVLDRAGTTVSIPEDL